MSALLTIGFGFVVIGALAVLTLAAVAILVIQIVGRAVERRLPDPELKLPALPVDRTIDRTIPRPYARDYATAVASRRRADARAKRRQAIAAEASRPPRPGGRRQAGATSTRAAAQVVGIDSHRGG